MRPTADTSRAPVRPGADGRWSGDVSGEVKERANTFGGRLRKDLSGTKAPPLSVGRELSETLDAKLTGNVDSKALGRHGRPR